MGEAVILGPDGAPLPVALRNRAKARAISNMRSYRAYEAAGRGHPSLANWNASGLSGHAAQRFDRDVLATRVADMVRNDPAVASAVDKKVNNIVGAGWRLSAKPDWRLLNITSEQAEAISETIEAWWNLYAHSAGFWCDAERQGDATDILQLAARHMETDGEAFGILAWRETPSPTGFHTAMQVVHPRRCSNPGGRPDTETLKDGVALDAMNAATGYHFRMALPGELGYRIGTYEWEYFEREFEDGRPRVAHAKLRDEAGVVRAVSKLVSVLRTTRQGWQYFDNELQASNLNAVMALFIETPFDAFEAMDAISPETLENAAQESAEYHKTVPVQVDGVQANFLAPGEKAELMRPEHPNAAFDVFMKNVLRSLAASVGLTYEQLTMDWSDVNYSSARAAIIEVAKGFKVIADRIRKQFLGPWYRAWLEELFDSGRITLPAGAVSFDAAPDAWAVCDWIGQGRGYVDPLKEVQAAGLRIAMGLSSMEDECAEQGKDYRRLIDQIVKELKLWRQALKAAGLDPDAIPHPSYGGVPAASALTKSIAANPPQGDDGAGEDGAGEGERAAEAAASATAMARLTRRSGVPLIKRKAA